MDDTIKSLRDKICCGIKTNAKFDSELYLVPSRQYFWSEYLYDDKINKITIGQKWMRRNELLNIDVEPLANIRIYEELRGQLKLLRDNIRRYNNKIRMEDDNNNILYDYQNYISGNEIYMIDLYNEFGNGYSPDAETIKNLQDIYLKLYFPRIKTDDVKTIIDLLNGNKKSELNKVSVIYETINNDLTIENEITETTEAVKMKDKYEHIVKENFITQSTIHLNLRFLEGTKLNLFRVFNEFIVDEKYPFVQYQTPDGNIAYKLNEKQIAEHLKIKENRNILSKWFENAPYGISFKVKTINKTGVKFIAIGLNENGRIEYKTQWKEEHMATLDDVKHTYLYVKELITKINSEKNKVKIEIPDDTEFKFAFINTIQKFELPNNFIINHNDLSYFSRYFYPYVALVIEPRKRQAKVPKASDKSKFGTYLRYKRVSGYGDMAGIEQRIMYFIRNFEFTEKALANEISKQFNITEDKAIEEYEKVRAKYPNIKKSRKVLKKLENIPKYKPPGIGIDIQGKQPEKYKIRISGARYKAQLDRIIKFMNILIFLYVETYHFKNPERQILKKKLEMLKNIAERRNKVDDVPTYSKDIKSVKQMTQIDKRRIGFKPEKGQNQWTRSCQNSGDDKKRRPQQYSNSTMDELLKKGYFLNKKTGNYEKRMMIKGKGGKKTEITLKTVKLSEFDEEGTMTGNEIHYACDPDENGDHFYVGFLTRSMNPFGHCMPCCFKKDPMISKNKEKQEFFKKCLGQTNITEANKGQKVIGDRLYILQDTNKIQEGRFGFLPKYLDIYFNYSLGKQKKIKHHYLVKTDTGYFFKYGSKQDEYQFLNAICSLFDITIDDIRSKVSNFLEKDKNDQIFTSLNNGDIKTQFGTKDEYISFIKFSDFLDFDLVNNILSVPGVISKNGLNIVVFQKKNIIIRKTFEKEKIREDFVLQCQNPEDIMGLRDEKKECVFMVKENKNYYPVVLVIKDNEATKSMDVVKTFVYENKPQNIVNHTSDFYEKNCIGSFMNSIVYKNSTLTARLTRHILSQLSDKSYHVKYQYIDVRNKCKYLITNNGLLIPVRPSGSLHDVQIVRNTDKFIMDYDKTSESLEKLYKLTNKQIPSKPIGVYYDEQENKIKRSTKDGAENDSSMHAEHDNDESTDERLKHDFTDTNDADGDSEIKDEDKKDNGDNVDNVDEVDLEIRQQRRAAGEVIRVNGIMTKTHDIIPVNPINMQTSKLEEAGLAYENKPLIDKVDMEIAKGKKNYIVDNRISSVNMDKYNVEGYELFRLEFSNYINRKENIGIKAKIEAIISNQVLNRKDRSDKIKLLLFRLIDKDLFNTFKSLMTSGTVEEDELDVQDGGKYDKLIHIVNKLPDVSTYQVNNDRVVCNINNSKDVCNTNPHCHWTHTGCYMSLTKEMTIKFVNKLTEELIQNNLKAVEIMQVEGYFVSDIVDYNRFTERDGQKIIRSTSNTIKKVLHETLGKEAVPQKIGRRKTAKNVEVNYQQLNSDNPLLDLKTFYVQKVIENNLSLFRSYVNGYYWLKNKYNDVDSRNLGYYSPLQTDLSNYFRSLVVDWLNDTKNNRFIRKEMTQYLDIKKSSKNAIKDFIIKLAKDISVITNSVIELHVLSKVNRAPIVVYNDYNTPIYIFDKGLVYDHKTDKKVPDTHVKLIKGENINCINLRFSYITNPKIPEDIEAIYFKE